MTQQENTMSQMSNTVSDRTTCGWHSPNSVLPPENEDVLIGYSNGTFCVGHWEKKGATEKECRIEWLSSKQSGLPEVVDYPDIWMIIPNPLLEESLVSGPTNIQEKWYLFDMEPEYVDPRFQYWLAGHGVVTRVNANGMRGLIASTRKELPAYFKDYLFEQPKSELEPLSIVLGETERIPNISELLNFYDKEKGKPSRSIRNPLDENFGRSPRRKVILEYFADTLATVSGLVTRINSCDRLGLDSEFSVEIKEAEEAVEFLRGCIDNNLTCHDSNLS